MADSQCAVFQFDVKTMSMQGAEGPVIFDSLADAERYSEYQISATPGVGCRIYDRDGKIVGTFADTQVYESFHGRPAARRSLLAGTVYLVIGVGLIILDVRLGFRLILGAECGSCGSRR